MSRVENTSERDPFEHLIGALESGGSSQYIEKMEAVGQQQLVNSTKLPAKVQRYSHQSRKDFEDLGFAFGQEDPTDPLFVEATLPEGWSRQGSDHSMWSYIVDERGLRRVAIFYKAAFYDRDAFMSLRDSGYELATDFLYAEGEPTPIPWDKLTDKEIRSVFESWDRMEEQIKETPSVFAKHQDRLDAGRTSIPEALRPR